MDRVTIDVEMPPAMQVFLKEMATKYDLSDPAKAIRCLINYARAKPDRLDDIFQTIRCPDC